MSNTSASGAQTQAAPTRVEIKHYLGHVLFECEIPHDREPLFTHLLSACKVSEAGCVEWQLTKTSGAGQVKINGRNEYAHRVMYELVHGPIPAGLMVRHSCDNRPCIRPDHLILGTHQDNMDDMVARGRSTKGRALSLEHRLRVGQAGRGRRHPEHVKQAIAASVRAYRAGFSIAAPEGGAQ